MSALSRFLLWDYERGSLPYELLSLALLLVLFVVPAVLWGDPMVMP